MFMFIANISHLDLNRLFTITNNFGTWKIIQRDSAALIWVETPFINVSEENGTVSVRLGCPIDQEPACMVAWDVAAEQLMISRRWSGEFAILFSRIPATIITSHLRFVLVVRPRLALGLKLVRPGGFLHLNLRKPHAGRWQGFGSFRAAHRMTYAQTLRRVRELIYTSVQQLPPSSGLLLSGGLDSSIIAAVARDLGKTLPAFTFSLSRNIREQPDWENDLQYARRVAKYLDFPLTEILITPSHLIKNVPLAILLAETWRGTIIDPSTALIEVTKRMSETGFSSVIMGEAADAIFGSFTFILRYKKGRELQRYYRRQLDVGFPEEIAVVQRICAAWELSLARPYWTSYLKKIGYNIPIQYRVDPQRAMKRVLRDAFKDLLPEEVIRRPKVIARNGSQVRFALEDRFGSSSDRYKPIFNRIFAKGDWWPKIVLPRIDRDQKPNGTMERY
jgi:asparagine synthetase B (glutamine-hydrolysing)